MAKAKTNNISQEAAIAAMCGETETIGAALVSQPQEEPAAPEAVQAAVMDVGEDEESLASAVAYVDQILGVCGDKGMTGYRATSVRIPDRMWRDVRILNTENGKSMNTMIVIGLGLYLKNHEAVDSMTDKYGRIKE